MGIFSAEEYGEYAVFIGECWKHTSANGKVGFVLEKGKKYFVDIYFSDGKVWIRPYSETLQSQPNLSYSSFHDVLGCWKFVGK